MVGADPLRRERQRRGAGRGRHSSRACGSARHVPGPGPCGAAGQPVRVADAESIGRHTKDAYPRRPRDRRAGVRAMRSERDGGRRRRHRRRGRVSCEYGSAASGLDAGHRRSAAAATTPGPRPLRSAEQARRVPGRSRASAGRSPEAPRRSLTGTSDRRTVGGFGGTGRLVLLGTGLGVLLAGASWRDGRQAPFLR
jgi:hypothetical protein